MPDTPSIKRLGLLSLTCLVIANMIGAGVYTSSGFALGDLGTPENVLFAWVTAGCIALLGAYCYGRLSQRMTESGGEYLFLSRSVSPVLGFMAGWVSLTAGFSGAIAYSALTFNVYLSGSEPLWGLPSATVPAVLILFFGLLHLWGMSVGTTFQNLLVVIKTIALLAFVVYGLAWIATQTDIANNPVSNESDTSTATNNTPSIGAFATSIMWLSFSYAGYNAAVYVAGTAKRPRIVAQSMVLATAIVTVLYVALNAVVLYSVPSETLVGKPEVLSLSAFAIGGETLKWTVNGIILVSLATSVSAMLHAAPHLYAQMARDGVLPAFLATSEDQPPRAGTILQIVLALFLTVFTSIQQLLDYLAFVLLLSSAVTGAILLIPPRFLRQAREPLTSEATPPYSSPFKSAFSVIAPLLFVVASLIIASLAMRFRFQTDTRGLLLALSILPIGLIAYRFLRH